MIEIFQTKDGMLKVEKSGGDPYAVSTFSLENKKKLSAASLLETAFGYQQPEYLIFSNKKEGTCELCGAPTGNGIRHICPNCWGKYESEIMNELLRAVRGKVVEIG